MISCGVQLLSLDLTVLGLAKPMFLSQICITNTHNFHKLSLNKRTWEANVLSTDVPMYVFY